MSTSQNTANTDTTTIAETVEQYLSDRITNERMYLKSREIAADLDYRTRQVASVMQTVDEMSDRIAVSKWAYSSSTTWLIEPI